MASSSTSSVPKSFKYDVFLSFRGEDTRNNFVDHLYHALERENIDTYKDDENMVKGVRICDELINAIEDSRFYIIVFSKNYASSSWCLDELLKIMECQKTTEQQAYPVFYDVEPTEVRKQSGPIGEAFDKRRMDEDAGKWRKALKEAADLAGFPLKNTANGHEAQFIQTILEVISKKLHSINISIDETLVGMETRVDDIVSFLETSFDDVRMIGIKGIGGGGKTTLARAVFDHISSQFEGKSFVENVKEVSRSSLSGLKSLQEKILKNVLGKTITVNDVHEGKKMMKWKMHGRKVLLVLDDVDHIDQLEALAGKNWFGPGSRIIITTRDAQVLIVHEVNSIHDVNLLTNEEAICLFNRVAFRIGEIPNMRFQELSQQVVHYADGLPLTIRVLGLDLKGKDELEWKDTLEKLKTIPLEETLKQLELSYMGLKPNHKDIFLDVACFWKGELKEDAIRVLESCKLHPRAGLRVLEQKSLITVSKDGCLEMHDHIQEMGRDIVRRLHPYTPYRHSRLWIDEEIENISANDLGTEATICTKWTMKLNQRIDMKGFRKMENLRFLHLVSPWDNRCSQINFKVDEASQNFPDALQYLFWQYYPFRCLPNTFRANNLVGLEMPYYRRGQLWESGEREVLDKLKCLVLDCSTLRTLDLGVTPNLETLSLIKCYSFEELHIPHKHPKLKSLLLSHSLLKSIDLRQTPNLEILNLEGCYKLEELHIPDECPTLKSLNLNCSNLRTIDLGRTLNLEMLVLEVCDDLVKLHMPDGHPELKTLFLKCSKLRTLDLGRTLNLELSSLEGCDDLVALHMPLGCPNLQSLKLLCSNLKSLNLEMTPNLETLTLKGCDNLVHISVRCPKLKSLKHNLSMLKTIDLKQTMSLEMLRLKECHDLLHIFVGCPNLKSLELGPSKLETLDLSETVNLETLSLNGCHDLVKLYMPVGCPKLKSLNFDCSKLRTLDLEGTPNLETLALTGCIDLVKLYMPVEYPKLKSLNIVCSKLRTLDLEGTPNLETLALIGCIDLVEILMPAGCPKLESFESSYLKMRTLDLRLTTDLERLNLQNCNDLVELSMPVKCPKLKTVSLSCSKLRTLNLGLTPDLEVLSLSECHDLVNLCMPVECPKLKTLFLTHSKLKILNLGLTPDLEMLELGACSDLVKLRMSRCLKLKQLELSSLSKLKKFDLWLTPNLKDLTLSDCCNLIELHAPAGCLENMDSFISSGCSRLNIFKSLGDDSVAELYLIVEPVDVCPLHPDNNLPKFRYRCYPSTVGKLEKLISVGLCACTNLKKFSRSIRSICDVQCLRKLTLKGSIPDVPKDLDRLENLEELCFLYTMVIHLPDSICMLRHLKCLRLEHCWLLEKVPEDLGRLECLEKLILLYCERLEEIPNSICWMKRLQLLNLTYCIRVKKLPEKLGHLVSLKKLWIEENTQNT